MKKRVWICSAVGAAVVAAVVGIVISKKRR